MRESQREQEKEPQRATEILSDSFSLWICLQSPCLAHTALDRIAQTYCHICHFCISGNNCTEHCVFCSVNDVLYITLNCTMRCTNQGNTTDARVHPTSPDVLLLSCMWAVYVATPDIARLSLQLPLAE